MQVIMISNAFIQTKKLEKDTFSITGMEKAIETRDKTKIAHIVITWAKFVGIKKCLVKISKKLRAVLSKRVKKYSRL